MTRVRMSALALVALGAGLLTPAAAFAQEGGGKASLAVAPFTFHRNVRAQPGAELETATLTQKFVTELVKTNKFDVLERARMEQLLEEMDLSNTGITDPARAVRAGKVIGVDYFLMGEVSVWTLTTTVKHVPIANRWTREGELRLIVDMRIVDTRTSKVVSAEKGDATLRWREMHTSQPGRHAPIEPAKLDDVQRDCVAQLVRKVIDAVYPLRVIAVNSSGEVMVNRGEGAGISEGDVYDVFSEGQELIDPDTGEVLGSEETKVGRIQIGQVLAKFSKAALVAGAAQKGQVCRPANGPASFAPPPPPPPPADRQAPTIRILAPKQGQQVSSTPVNVVAEVHDDRQLERVTINGADARRDERGLFRVRISQPSDGRNGIEVRAWDAAGNEAVARSEFTFDATPPVVQADATIVVDGSVDDVDCTLTVNGVQVEFDKQTGRYSVRVPADPQDPGRVVIVATDPYGNQTQEVRRLR